MSVAIFLGGSSVPQKKRPNKVAGTLRRAVRLSELTAILGGRQMECAGGRHMECVGGRHMECAYYFNLCRLCPNRK